MKINDLAKQLLSLRNWNYFEMHENLITNPKLDKEGVNRRDIMPINIAFTIQGDFAAKKLGKFFVAPLSEIISLEEQNKC